MNAVSSFATQAFVLIRSSGASSANLGRHRVFVSEIIGVQVVRTPASANINLGRRGAYQFAVGIEGVQKAGFIEAGIWLNAPQRGDVYEEGRLHRAIMPPEPDSMPRPVV